MLLSQKLHELRETVNAQTAFTPEIASAFSECTENAEQLEHKLSKVKDLLKTIKTLEAGLEMCSFGWVVEAAKKIDFYK